MILGEDPWTARFGRIYPFTTENISGYVKFFDLYKKSLLTVGSSGDQVINARLAGCQDITVVDVNPYTQYYYYLKVASILSLKIEELKSFLNYMQDLFVRNRAAFDKKKFLRIKGCLKELDYDSYYFWDEKFAIRRPLNVRKAMFMRDEFPKSIITKCNLYLHSEEMYKRTQAIIGDIRPNFIVGNLLYDDIPGVHDNIWLSTIPAFIDLKTLRLLVDKMYLLLKKEGDMMVSYLYLFDEFTPYERGWDPIYDIDRVKQTLSPYKLELKSFHGTEFREDSDSVLILHK